jgi:predicted metal-dependent TIM-barrel fold hydrolase
MCWNGVDPKMVIIDHNNEETAKAVLIGLLQHLPFFTQEQNVEVKEWVEVVNNVV